MLGDFISDALGDPVTSMSPLSGGDVAESYRVTLASGRVLFAKTKRGAPTGFFTTEANGLEWLPRGRHGGDSGGGRGVRRSTCAGAGVD